MCLPAALAVHKKSGSYIYWIPIDCRIETCRNVSASGQAHKTCGRSCAPHWSSAHQSCWLLTWMSLPGYQKATLVGTNFSVLLLLSLKTSIAVTGILNCTSLWRRTGLLPTRCCGIWSIREAETKSLLPTPKYMKIPLYAHCNLILQLATHGWNTLFTFVQASSCLISFLVLPIFLLISLCLHFSHQPDLPVCSMALLPAWGLGRLLSLLLQQALTHPHYPLPKLLDEALNPYVNPLIYTFSFTLHHLIWGRYLESICVSFSPRFWPLHPAHLPWFLIATLSQPRQPMGEDYSSSEHTCELSACCRKSISYKSHCVYCKAMWAQWRCSV